MLRRNLKIDKVLRRNLKLKFAIMNEETVIYPLYRKYANNKSFYKIISPEKFEEIQLLKDNRTLHVFEAKILPDRNYIHDLTFNYKEHWVVCEEEEYEKIKSSL